MTKFVKVTRPATKGSDEQVTAEVPERMLKHYENRGWSREVNDTTQATSGDSEAGHELKGGDAAPELVAGDATASGTADSKDGKQGRSRGASTGLS